MCGGERYDVQVNGRRWFVGDLALTQSSDAVRALDGDRAANPASSVLLAVTLALFGDEPVELGFGLPLDSFRNQRYLVQRWLAAFSAKVSIPDVFPGTRTVRVQSAHVYPQEVAALIWVATTVADELLGEAGYAVLVDVGYKTTDVVTVNVKNLKPIEEASASFARGAHDLDAQVVRAIRDRYGSSLRAETLEPFWNEETISVRGREVPMAQLRAEAAETLAQALAGQLTSLLGERIELVRRIFLAGGVGRLVEPGLRSLGIPTSVIEDPQFANARGYLTMLEKARSEVEPGV